MSVLALALKGIPKFSKHQHPDKILFIRIQKYCAVRYSTLCVSVCPDRPSSFGLEQVISSRAVGESYQHGRSLSFTLTMTPGEQEVRKCGHESNCRENGRRSIRKRRRPLDNTVVDARPSNGLTSAPGDPAESLGDKHVKRATVFERLQFESRSASVRVEEPVRRVPDDKITSRAVFDRLGTQVGREDAVKKRVLKREGKMGSNSDWDSLGPPHMSFLGCNNFDRVDADTPANVGSTRPKAKLPPRKRQKRKAGAAPKRSGRGLSTGSDFAAATDALDTVAADVIPEPIRAVRISPVGESPLESVLQTGTATKAGKPRREIVGDVMVAECSRGSADHDQCRGRPCPNESWSLGTGNRARALLSDAARDVSLLPAQETRLEASMAGFEQHRRNVSAWDGLFSTRYPPVFLQFERALRVLARSYLDNQEYVKQLPVDEVSVDLDAAFSRLKECQDKYPACVYPSAFEAYVVGTERSIDAVGGRIDAMKLADEKLVEQQRVTWSARDRAYAILRTCTRFDRSALDSNFVDTVLHEGVDDIDTAINSNFNELFGAAGRFSACPQTSWIENYRNMRDAYSFASHFSQDYFSLEGLVSCAVGQVPENDVILAHERCFRAFPNPASCPVTLDHMSWTCLSEVEFARKIVQSTSRDMFASAFGMQGAPLRTETMSKLISSTALTIDDFRGAAAHVASNRHGYRCWSESGAFAALLLGRLGGDEADNLSVAQADGSTSNCHSTADLKGGGKVSHSAISHLANVEEACASFSPPRRFCDSEDWAGLSDVDFASRVYHTFTSVELASFFNLPRVGSGLHALLKRSSVSLDEAYRLLADEYNESTGRSFEPDVAKTRLSKDSSPRQVREKNRNLSPGSLTSRDTRLPRVVQSRDR